MAGTEPVTNNTGLAALRARVDDNRRRIADTLAVGRDQRARICAELSASTLLVLDLLRAGLETDQAAYEQVSHGLEPPLAGRGPSHTRLARLVLGHDVDRRRIWRVAAAARELHDSGTNDPQDYLVGHGGVTGCAVLWGQRDAGFRSSEGKNVRRNGGGDAPPLAVPAWMAPLLAGPAGRRVKAVLEIGRSGAVSVVCLQGPKLSTVEIADPHRLSNADRRQLGIPGPSHACPPRPVLKTSYKLFDLVHAGALRVVAQADAADAMEPTSPTSVPDDADEAATYLAGEARDRDRLARVGVQHGQDADQAATEEPVQPR